MRGWSQKRRVIVLRRPIKNEAVYEYAVLISSLGDPLLAIAQHYRDRGDMENNFDELKNQWGWGGYTTRDMKRCAIAEKRGLKLYCGLWIVDCGLWRDEVGRKG